jgi:hypothetical protein
VNGIIKLGLALIYTITAITKWHAPQGKGLMTGITEFIGACPKIVLKEGIV